jgi:hypothetical protein
MLKIESRRYEKKKMTDQESYEGLSNLKFPHQNFEFQGGQLMSTSMNNVFTMKSTVLTPFPLIHNSCTSSCMASACGPSFLPTWFKPTELSTHESSSGAEAGNAVVGSVSQRRPVRHALGIAA